MGGIDIVLKPRLPARFLSSCQLADGVASVGWNIPEWFGVIPLKSFVIDG